MPGKKKSKKSKQKKAQAEGSQPEGTQPEGSQPGGGQPGGGQPGGGQPGGGQPVSSSNNITRVKVEVSKFHPVYIARTNDPNEECTMCRRKIVESCIDCFLAGKGPELCPYVTGKCRHRFHLHCIQGWLTKGHTKCPAQACSSAKWEFASYSRI